MSYDKQTWVTGEVITAAKLNHMEDGIASGGSAFDFDQLIDTSDPENTFIPVDAVAEMFNSLPDVLTTSMFAGIIEQGLSLHLTFSTYLDDDGVFGATWSGQYKTYLFEIGIVLDGNVWFSVLNIYGESRCVGFSLDDVDQTTYVFNPDFDCGFGGGGDPI